MQGCVKRYEGGLRQTRDTVVCSGLAIRVVPHVLFQSLTRSHHHHAATPRARSRSDLSPYLFASREPAVAGTADRCDVARRQSFARPGSCSCYALSCPAAWADNQASDEKPAGVKKVDAAGAFAR